ncbi:hypothetical protein ZWY2020_036809 [Hordeum vulgare]|nr:hypothetical protein ZWY2020_036809 [Hordeum vulgare]
MDAPSSPPGLQGPRPPRLKVRRESHDIKKPSGAPEQSQAQGHGRRERPPRMDAPSSPRGLQGERSPRMDAPSSPRGLQGERPPRMDAPYSPRGLQGPRPPRLKVRQESHAIKKPSGAPEQSQAQGHGRLEQQRRQAVRIDANPSFRELVQYLSGGVPASDSLVHQLVGQGSESQTQDFQIVEAGEWQPSLPSEQLLSAAISPAGRLASTDRSLRPVPTRPPDVIDLTDDRFEDGGLAGIADDDWLSLKGALPSSPPPDSTSGQFLPQGPKSVKQLKQTVSDISHEVHSQVKQACHTKKRTQQIQAPVCAMADAMFRLPEKLDALLASHGQTLPRGAEEEIPLIKQDLEKMVAILQEHDDSGAEDRAMTAKCLAKEVRELSYDMEDSVDQYEQTATTSKWIAPRLKKQKFARRRVTRLPVKLRWRLWMANKIREFSLRSQEALQRYSLFNHHGDNAIRAAAIGGTGTSTPPRHDASFGSWYPTPYEELVGIGEHVNNLEAWLGRDGEQRLKVVTVVGSGGIGKSTLVKELYRRMKGQFECRAFVRTSRKPNIRRLLINMLSQVRPHQTSHTWKLHSLIADIRTHLQDKRYLIVIDDVWATQTWDIVNRALPDGNLYSGILITTEIDDVALKCGGYDSKLNKQHGVLQKDYRDDGNKHAHGRRTLPKWSTQVRVSSLQDIEGHDDGFSWRKYGQKDILGSRYPRRYYRCKHRLTQGCKAVKQLQATDGDPLLFNAMYVGNHICIQRVNLQPQPGHEQSTISVGDKAEGSMQRLEKMPLRRSKRSIQVRMMSMQEDYPADDGYSWSKYGQKDILGSKHPRCYYRCVHKHDKGCQATKQVQRSDSDTQLFDIVYHGEHTCAENVHSQCESAHLLPHHISASMGLMPPATSEPVDQRLDLNADFVDDTGYPDTD